MSRGIRQRRMSRRAGPVLVALVAALMVSGMVSARHVCAAEEESATELAKKTQNPVADLISVPFQNNLNFNAGSKDETVYILNIQPVVPISLNADWNLITRTIVPVIDQPALFPGADSARARGGNKHGRQEDDVGRSE